MMFRPSVSQSPRKRSSSSVRSTVLKRYKQDGNNDENDDSINNPNKSEVLVRNVTRYMNVHIRSDMRVPPDEIIGTQCYQEKITHPKNGMKTGDIIETHMTIVKRYVPDLDPTFTDAGLTSDDFTYNDLNKLEKPDIFGPQSEYHNGFTIEETSEETNDFTTEEITTVDSMVNYYDNIARRTDDIMYNPIQFKEIEQQEPIILPSPPTNNSYPNLTSNLNREIENKPDVFKQENKKKPDTLYMEMKHVIHPEKDYGDNSYISDSSKTSNASSINSEKTSFKTFSYPRNRNEMEAINEAATASGKLSVDERIARIEAKRTLGELEFASKMDSIRCGSASRPKTLDQMSQYNGNLLDNTITSEYGYTYESDDTNEEEDKPRLRELLMPESPPNPLKERILKRNIPPKEEYKSVMFNVDQPNLKPPKSPKPLYARTEYIIPRNYGSKVDGGVQTDIIPGIGPLSEYRYADFSEAQNEFYKRESAEVQVTKDFGVPKAPPAISLSTPAKKYRERRELAKAFGLPPEDESEIPKKTSKPSKRLRKKSLRERKKTAENNLTRPALAPFDQNLPPTMQNVMSLGSDTGSMLSDTLSGSSAKSSTASNVPKKSSSSKLSSSKRSSSSKVSSSKKSTQSKLSSSKKSSSKVSSSKRSSSSKASTKKSSSSSLSSRKSRSSKTSKPSQYQSSYASYYSSETQKTSTASDTSERVSIPVRLSGARRSAARKSGYGSKLSYSKGSSARPSAALKSSAARRSHARNSAVIEIKSESSYDEFYEEEEEEEEEEEIEEKVKIIDYSSSSEPPKSKPKPKQVIEYEYSDEEEEEVIEEIIEKSSYSK